MHAIVEAISNPYWWFSVIVVGIGVNFLSAFLTSIFSRYTSRYSATRTRKRAQEDEARAARIERMRQSDREFQIAQHYELKLRLLAISFPLIGVIAVFTVSELPPQLGVAGVLWAHVLTKGIMTVCIFTAVGCLRYAGRIADEINESLRRK